MDVSKEVKSAKKLMIWGLVIVVVSLVFILASVVLAVYDYAELQGWERVQNLANSIYAQTQFPVLSTIWKIAARPYLIEPMHLHNLWFFGEFVAFLSGAAMVGSANRTLENNAEAAFKAKQQSRQDQYQKMEQEKLK